MVSRFVSALARAVEAVDARSPIAVNQRTAMAYTELGSVLTVRLTFRLIVDEARTAEPYWFTDATFSIPYPSAPRQKCDLKVVTRDGELFVEGKLLRLMGDNGKPNDNMLMHILSPYPQHRSALTDCAKLAKSQFPGVKLIVILGYGYAALPLEPAVSAFRGPHRKGLDIGRGGCPVIRGGGRDVQHLDGQARRPVGGG
jgi:hypothetical protein